MNAKKLHELADQVYEFNSQALIKELADDDLYVLLAGASSLLVDLGHLVDDAVVELGRRREEATK